MSNYAGLLNEAIINARVYTHIYLFMLTFLFSFRDWKKKNYLKTECYQMQLNNHFFKKWLMCKKNVAPSSERWIVWELKAMQYLLPGAEQSIPALVVLLAGLASRYHVKLKKLCNFTELLKTLLLVRGAAFRLLLLETELITAFGRHRRQEW